MGFTVAEELTFPKLGISQANCYVTIKASFAHSKQGAPSIGMMPMPMNPSAYSLTFRLSVYAANNSTLDALHQEVITIPLDEAAAVPITAIYAWLKSERYAGKTITDDL